MNNYAEEAKKDKDDMKDGNDQFLNVIHQIIEHETKRTQLEEKLKILKWRGVYTNKTDEIVRQAEIYLQQQVEPFLKYRNELHEVLSAQKMEVEVIKRRYEEEKKKRSEEEHKLINRKKRLEDEQQKIVVLMAEKIILNKKLEFLREGFKEEIKELEYQVQNEKKVISESNRRSLDLEPIIQSLEAHYAEIADRTKQEADQLNRKKIEALRQTSEQYEQETQKKKHEIIILNKNITDLRSKLEIYQEKEEILKKELEQEGEGDAEITRLDIIKLDKQLKDKKKELALQVCDHQRLLNLKMGLDMEIATYRELLKNVEESFKDISSEVYITNQNKVTSVEITAKVAGSTSHYEEISFQQ